MTVAPPRPGPGWLPTPALGRAVLVGGVGAALAVVIGAPSLLVLVAPLLLIAAMARAGRPPADQPPRFTAALDHRALQEGQGATSRLRIGAATHAEQVTRALQPGPHLAFRPASGTVAGLVPVGGPDETVAAPVLQISPRRWGRRVLGAERVALTSPWAGYRCGPVDLDGTLVRVLPGAPSFVSRAQAPRPAGLVGAHRSTRAGQGTEFADIRPFRAGDRLRRISWRVSARAEELHVVTSPAEQDTGVLLVVDALADHGRSGGPDGAASSLDLTVRAASALATHHVRAGDRVGMRVVGGDGGLVHLGSGTRHLRVLQDTLAGLRPGGLPDGIADRVRLRVRGGCLVFVLSPVLDPAIVTATASLARRGLPVVVVDTLPDGVRPDVPDDVAPRVADLAWRMRRLERDQVLQALGALACPVVPWRGAGSVDQVLGRLSRVAPHPAGSAR